MGGAGRARRGNSNTRFPVSPICAPTTSKLVPRNENAPLPPFLPDKPRPSTSSGRSILSSRPRSSYDPPIWPPLPHVSPLHIPDPVVPDPGPASRPLKGTPQGNPPRDIGMAVSRDGEVRDLTEYDGRGSWGSWGTRVVSPVLKEGELERMGGKYT